MITRDELARRLSAANVVELCRRSGVAEKTIYRLRHRMHAPTLDTLEKVMPVLEQMEREVNSHAAALCCSATDGAIPHAGGAAP